jgi:hypothetical protein
MRMTVVRSSAVGMVTVRMSAIMFALTIPHIPFKHFQFILMANFKVVIHVPEPSGITGDFMHGRHAGHGHGVFRHRRHGIFRHDRRLRFGPRHGFCWFFHNAHSLPSVHDDSVSYE